MRTKLRALGDRIAYYEWAYGFLAEADSDIGQLAEWMVGKAFGCLPKSRSVNARFDLVMKDGRGVEVKATGKRRKMSGNKPPAYRWDVDTQLGSHDPSTIAPLWFFLIADFPEDAKSDRRFDVFNPRYWSVCVVTGEQLASTGVKRYVYEATLRRLGLSFVPFADLKSIV